MIKKQVIICVDDEKFVLDALLKQLKRKFGDKYEYEIAESGEETIELIKELRTEGHDVVMVISDQIMPGLTGEQLLTYINEQNHKTIKILLTGQASLESAIGAINNADLFRYIAKPWQESDFILTVEKGIQQYSLQEESIKQAEVFSHFVPKEFLDLLSINSILDVKLGDSVQKEMVVMFSDIRDFTSKSEKMSPKEIFDFINSYLSYIEPNITENKGFVDKYIGDSIMALFYSADDVLQAAVNMQLSLQKFNKNFSEEAFAPVKIGIGLHSGQLMLGIVGVPSRLQSTVFSDTVNTASRLERLTKKFSSDIIISEELYSAILKNKEGFVFRYLGRVLIRGRKSFTNIFEVLSPNLGTDSSLRIKTMEDFANGIQSYISGDFAEACIHFKKVYNTNPDDKAAHSYLQLAADLITKPSEENWQGVILGA